MKTDKFTEIINQIKINYPKALENIKFNALWKYVLIMTEYKKQHNVANNKLFMKTFCDFYKVTKRNRKQKWINTYFSLFNTSLSIDQLLLKLRTKYNKFGVEFSFATKLLHTQNNKLPIYDLKVAKFTGWVKSRAKYPMSIKENSKLYEYYKKQYHKLLHKRIIQHIIREFREKFNLIAKTDKKLISDTKVLDFILWKLPTK